MTIKRNIISICASIFIIALFSTQALAQGKAYIATTIADSVTIFDVPSGQVVGSVDGFGGVTRDAACTPDGFQIYVPVTNNPSIKVIQANSNDVITIPVPDAVDPLNAVVSPDGKFAYISSEVGVNGAVFVIDTAENTIVDKIDTPWKAIGIDVTPDGQFLYVTQSNDTVIVIRTSDNQIVDTIATELGPVHLVVSNDGSRVYVTTSASNTVSIIGTFNNEVLGTIVVQKSPVGIDITNDDKFLYVTNLVSNTVSVISTESNSVVDTIPVGDLPAGIGVSPDGTQVWVMSSGTAEVYVINRATNTVIQRQQVVGSPDGYATFFCSPPHPRPIPTVSTLGLAAVALVLFGAGVYYLRRKQTA